MASQPPKILSSTDFTNVVRIAPLSDYEAGLQQQYCVRRLGNSWKQLVVQVRDGHQDTGLIPGALHQQESGHVKYALDGVLDHSTDQAAFYRCVVRPVVEQTLQGYHGSVIALGAKGTGKKFTMRGPEKGVDARDRRGAIVRAAEHIFHCLRLSPSLARGLVVIVSYLAIYKEEFHDLLADVNVKAASTTKLPGTSTDFPGSHSASVTVDEDGLLQGVSEHVVSTTAEVEDLLQAGIQQESRLIASSVQSNGSSHVIFTITVEHSGMGSDFAPISGMLRLVELADLSQAALTGAQRGGVAPPNQDKSLHAFLKKLLSGHHTELPSAEKGQPEAIEGAGGVDGESRLMRLLPGCVGGNSKTVLVWNVSPDPLNHNITSNVLSTATLCKGIRNHPDKRDLAEQALMNAYIRALRQKHRILIVNKAAKSDKAVDRGPERPRRGRASKASRLAAQADDVLWDPTQAGKLLPYQARKQAQDSSNLGSLKNAHTGASTESIEDDSGDDCYGTSKVGKENGMHNDSSDDEYNFDDVMDTTSSSPEDFAEVLSAEDAANALAAAAMVEYSEEDVKADNGKTCTDPKSIPVLDSHYVEDGDNGAQKKQPSEYHNNMLTLGMNDSESVSGVPHLLHSINSHSKSQASGLLAKDMPDHPAPEPSGDEVVTPKADLPPRRRSLLQRLKSAKVRPAASAKTAHSQDSNDDLNSTPFEPTTSTEDPCPSKQRKGSWVSALGIEPLAPNRLPPLPPKVAVSPTNAVATMAAGSKLTASAMSTLTHGSIASVPTHVRASTEAVQKISADADKLDAATATDIVATSPSEKSIPSLLVSTGKVAPDQHKSATAAKSASGIGIIETSKKSVLAADGEAQPLSKPILSKVMIETMPGSIDIPAGGATVSLLEVEDMTAELPALHQTPSLTTALTAAQRPPSGSTAIVTSAQQSPLSQDSSKTANTTADVPVTDAGWSRHQGSEEGDRHDGLTSESYLNVNDAIAILSGDAEHCSRESLTQLLELLQHIVCLAIESTASPVEVLEISGAEFINLMWEEAFTDLADREQAVRIAQHLLSAQLLIETGCDLADASNRIFVDSDDVSYVLRTAETDVDNGVCLLKSQYAYMLAASEQQDIVPSGYGNEEADEDDFAPPAGGQARTHSELHGHLERSGAGSRAAWTEDVQDYTQEIDPDELVYDYQTGKPYIPPTSSSKYVSLEPFTSDQLLIDQDFLHPFHSACVLAKHAGMLRNLVLMFGVEHSDSHQRTPLMYAVLGDKPSFLSCLLECGAKPEKYDSFGYTALHHATRLGHIKSAQTILNKVLEDTVVQLIRQVDCEGLNALHWATRLESDACLNMYLRHTGSLPGLVNTMDNFQQTPLFWAISQSKAKHTSLLLKNLADPTAIDGARSPATHHAIRCHAVTCLKELLAHRSNLIGCCDVNGQTALHIAATEKCRECLSIVLKVGGKKWQGINTVDCLQQTALHCAAISDSADVLQVLLQRGADIGVRDVNGCTPLQCADEQGHVVCKQLLQEAEEALARRNKGSSVCTVT